MADTQEYKKIESVCLNLFYLNQGLVKIDIAGEEQRRLFGNMELDIIGYSEKDRTLFLGEFTASGFFGLNGKENHIGAKRKLAESFLKLYICRQKENEIKRYLNNYKMEKFKYIFAVPKGALFLSGLTYQKEIFDLSFLELHQIEIDKESKDRLEKSYRTARAENKK